jgi:hypothetical protein
VIFQALNWTLSEASERLALKAAIVEKPGTDLDCPSEGAL